ncbi:MAG: hypothetical protein L3J63_11210 [Geopsychrobacter sp.]|nr:hypothetical protein [Geopsychrobacter sp.]
MEIKFLQFLHKQGFWLLIFFSLLGAQVQLASPFQHFSFLSEISQAQHSSLPVNDLASACDPDDCSDLLQTSIPEVSRANESSLPLPLAPLWLQRSVSEISLPYLSRPPPVSSFS